MSGVAKQERMEKRVRWLLCYGGGCNKKSRALLPNTLFRPVEWYKSGRNSSSGIS
jgi:hypothetical protein